MHHASPSPCDSEPAAEPASPVGFAVAMLPGSLPMGGVVEGTPVYGFRRTPAALLLSRQSVLPSRRTDLDVGGPPAFVIDGVLTRGEADAVVAASEVLGYSAAAPGIVTAPGMRLNKSVHWVSDESFLGEVYRRIVHLLPAQLDGHKLHGRFSHRINMYRYDRDDVFNRHTDGDWPGYGLSADGQHMVEWQGVRSKLTMLLYLNGLEDGVSGGHTRLYARDGRVVEVAPKGGSALFFRHGFGRDSVVHEGCRVTGAVPKYVARINVLYQSAHSRE